VFGECAGSRRAGWITPNRDENAEILVCRYMCCGKYVVGRAKQIGIEKRRRHSSVFPVSLFASSNGNVP